MNKLVEILIGEAWKHGIKKVTGYKEPEEDPITFLGFLIGLAKFLFFCLCAYGLYASVDIYKSWIMFLASLMGVALVTTRSIGCMIVVAIPVLMLWIMAWDTYRE